jgi:hypothetical protein
MPVILPEEHHARWLGEVENGDPKELLQAVSNRPVSRWSNRRIIAVDGQHQTVTFTYRDYRHGSQRK